MTLGHRVIRGACSIASSDAATLRVSTSSSSLADASLSVSPDECCRKQSQRRSVVSYSVGGSMTAASSSSRVILLLLLVVALGQHLVAAETFVPTGKSITPARAGESVSVTYTVSLGLVGTLLSNTARFALDTAAINAGFQFGPAARCTRGAGGLSLIGQTCTSTYCEGAFELLALLSPITMTCEGILAPRYANAVLTMNMYINVNLLVLSINSKAEGVAFPALGPNVLGSTTFAISTPVLTAKPSFTMTVSSVFNILDSNNLVRFDVPGDANYIVRPLQACTVAKTSSPAGTVSIPLGNIVTSGTQVGFRLPVGFTVAKGEGIIINCPQVSLPSVAVGPTSNVVVDTFLTTVNQLQDTLITAVLPRITALPSVLQLSAPLPSTLSVGAVIPSTAIVNIRDPSNNPVLDPNLAMAVSVAASNNLVGGGLYFSETALVPVNNAGEFRVPANNVFFMTPGTYSIVANVIQTSTTAYNIASTLNALSVNLGTVTVYANLLPIYNPIDYYVRGVAWVRGRGAASPGDLMLLSPTESLNPLLPSGDRGIYGEILRPTDQGRPAARAYQAHASDNARGKTILFGGITGLKSVTQASITNYETGSPFASNGGGYGGYSGTIDLNIQPTVAAQGILLNDLWEFNIVLNQWTLLWGSPPARNIRGVSLGDGDASASSPAPRHSASLTVDPVSGDIYLYGGASVDLATGEEIRFGDLWVYRRSINMWVGLWRTASQRGYKAADLITAPTSEPGYVAYDPDVSYTTLPPPLKHVSLFVADKSGRLWLYGGETWQRKPDATAANSGTGLAGIVSSPISNTYMYTVASALWTAIAPVAAAPDLDKRGVLSFSPTEVPSTTIKTGVTAMPALSGASSIYDPARNVAYMYGGAYGYISTYGPLRSTLTPVGSQFAYSTEHAVALDRPPQLSSTLYRLDMATQKWVFVQDAAHSTASPYVYQGMPRLHPANGASTSSYSTMYRTPGARVRHSLAISGTHLMLYGGVGVKLGAYLPLPSAVTQSPYTTSTSSVDAAAKLDLMAGPFRTATSAQRSQTIYTAQDLHNWNFPINTPVNNIQIAFKMLTSGTVPAGYEFKIGAWFDTVSSFPLSGSITPLSTRYSADKMTSFLPMQQQAFTEGSFLTWPAVLYPLYPEGSIAPSSSATSAQRRGLTKGLIWDGTSNLIIDIIERASEVSTYGVSHRTASGLPLRAVRFGTSGTSVATYYIPTMLLRSYGGFPDGSDGTTEMEDLWTMDVSSAPVWPNNIGWNLLYGATPSRLLSTRRKTLGVREEWATLNAVTQSWLGGRADAQLVVPQLAGEANINNLFIVGGTTETPYGTAVYLDSWSIELGSTCLDTSVSSSLVCSASVLSYSPKNSPFFITSLSDPPQKASANACATSTAIATCGVTFGRGVCESGAGEYSCRCNDYWSGDNCQGPQLPATYLTTLKSSAKLPNAARYVQTATDPYQFPGGRAMAQYANDPASDLVYMYGGYSTGSSSDIIKLWRDLWAYNPQSQRWALLFDDASPPEVAQSTDVSVTDGSAYSSYSTFPATTGTTCPGCRPGPSLGGALWVSTGKIYLYTAGKYSSPDVWMFDPASPSSWSWMNGPANHVAYTTAAGAVAIHSGIGGFAPGNRPNPREGFAWAGNSNGLYIFGGGSLWNTDIWHHRNNDVWMYDTAIHQWGLLSGSPRTTPYSPSLLITPNNDLNTYLRSPVYTSFSVLPSTNVPNPGDRLGAAGALTKDGTRFLIFGGTVERRRGSLPLLNINVAANDANLKTELSNSLLSNELWCFDLPTRKWVTLATATLNGAYNGTMAVQARYTTKGVPKLANMPAARIFSSMDISPKGVLYIAGGLGYDTNSAVPLYDGSAPRGYLSDVWSVNIPTSRASTYTTSNTPVKFAWKAGDRLTRLAGKDPTQPTVTTDPTVLPAGRVGAQVVVAYKDSDNTRSAPLLLGGALEGASAIPQSALSKNAFLNVYEHVAVEGVWQLATVCAESPCRNGGTCQNTFGGLGNEAFKCTCPAGFTGQYCEKNVCDGVVCNNGGTCQANGNTYKCVCSPGYTGVTCEPAAIEVFVDQYESPAYAESRTWAASVRISGVQSGGFAGLGDLPASEELLLVHGGLAARDASGARILSELALWNMRSRTWTTLKNTAVNAAPSAHSANSAPQSLATESLGARYAHTMVRLPASNTVVMFGGYGTLASGAFSLLDSLVEINLDASTFTWRTGDGTSYFTPSVQYSASGGKSYSLDFLSLPSARAFHSAAALPLGHSAVAAKGWYMFMYGGYGSMTGGPSNVHGYLSDLWIAKKDDTSGAFSWRYVNCRGDQLNYDGSHPGNGFRPTQANAASFSTAPYPYATHGWCPSARARAGLAIDKQGRGWVVGGIDRYGPSNELWMFDTDSSGTWYLLGGAAVETASPSFVFSTIATSSGIYNSNNKLGHIYGAAWSVNSDGTKLYSYGGLVPGFAYADLAAAASNELLEIIQDRLTPSYHPLTTAYRTCSHVYIYPASELTTAHVRPNVAPLQFGLKIGLPPTGPVKLTVKAAFVTAADPSNTVTEDHSAVLVDCLTAHNMETHTADSWLMFTCPGTLSSWDGSANKHLILKLETDASSAPLADNGALVTRRLLMPLMDRASHVCKATTLGSGYSSPSQVSDVTVVDQANVPTLRVVYGDQTVAGGTWTTTNTLMAIDLNQATVMYQSTGIPIAHLGGATRVSSLNGQHGGLNVDAIIDLTLTSDAPKLDKDLGFNTVLPSLARPVATSGGALIVDSSNNVFMTFGASGLTEVLQDVAVNGDTLRLGLNMNTFVSANTALDVVPIVSSSPLSLTNRAFRTLAIAPVALSAVLSASLDTITVSFDAATNIASNIGGYILGNLFDCAHIFDAASVSIVGAFVDASPSTLKCKWTNAQTLVLVGLGNKFNVGSQLTIKYGVIRAALDVSNYMPAATLAIVRDASIVAPSVSVTLTPVTVTSICSDLTINLAVDVNTSGRDLLSVAYIVEPEASPEGICPPPANPASTPNCRTLTTQEVDELTARLNVGTGILSRVVGAAYVPPHTVFKVRVAVMTWLGFSITSPAFVVTRPPPSVAIVPASLTAVKVSAINAVAGPVPTIVLDACASDFGLSNTELRYTWVEAGTDTIVTALSASANSTISQLSIPAAYLPAQSEVFLQLRVILLLADTLTPTGYDIGRGYWTVSSNMRVYSEYLASPAVTVAQFSSDLASLVVSFNANIDISTDSMNSVARCMQLFATSTLNYFGTGFTCEWASPTVPSSSITVTLGEGYTLRETHSIGLIGGLLGRAGASEPSLRMLSVLQPVSLGTVDAPNLSVPMGDLVVRFCDGAMSLVSAATNAGNIKLKYEWTMLSSPAIARFNALRDAQTVSAEGSTSTAFSTTGSPKYLPSISLSAADVAEIFPPGTVATVQVRGINWAGVNKDVSFTVTSTSLTVSVSLPVTLTLTNANQVVSVTPTNSISVCNDQPKTYSVVWSLVSGGISTVTLPTAASTTGHLQFPVASVVNAGTKLRATVGVSIDGTTIQVSGSADMDVVMDYPAAPAATKVQVLDDLAGLDITYGADTNGLTLSTSTLCSLLGTLKTSGYPGALIGNALSDVIGTGATCAFTNTKTLRVTFGANHLVQIDDKWSISVPIRSLDLSSIVGPAFELSVTSPATPIKPQLLTISAGASNTLPVTPASVPASTTTPVVLTVTPCANVLITASLAATPVGTGGRALKYTWASTKDFFNNAVTTLLPINTNQPYSTSSSPQPIATLTLTPDVVFDSFLPSDTAGEHTITLRATNWVGAFVEQAFTIVQPSVKFNVEMPTGGPYSKSVSSVGTHVDFFINIPSGETVDPIVTTASVISPDGGASVTSCFNPAVVNEWTFITGSTLNGVTFPRSSMSIQAGTMIDFDSTQLRWNVLGTVTSTGRSVTSFSRVFLTYGYLSGPVIESVQFSNDLSKIVVKFNAAVDTAASIFAAVTTPLQLCEVLMSAASVARLGPSAEVGCAWSGTKDSLDIQLGSGYSIRSGGFFPAEALTADPSLADSMRIQFLGGLIRLGVPSATSFADAVTVLAAASPLAPTVTLGQPGPMTWSYCSSPTTLTTTTGGVAGKNALHFVWSVSGTGITPAEQLAVANYLTTAYSSAVHKAWEFTATASPFSASSITIAPELLSRVAPPNGVRTIELKVKNWAGAQSSTVSITFQHNLAASLTLYSNGQTVPKAQASALTAEIVAVESCAGVSYGATWTYVSADVISTDASGVPVLTTTTATTIGATGVLGVVLPATGLQLVLPANTGINDKATNVKVSCSAQVTVGAHTFTLPASIITFTHSRVPPSALSATISNDLTMVTVAFNDAMLSTYPSNLALAHCGTFLEAASVTALGTGSTALCRWTDNRMAFQIYFGDDFTFRAGSTVQFETGLTRYLSTGTTSVTSVTLSAAAVPVIPSFSFTSPAGADVDICSTGVTFAVGNVINDGGLALSYTWSLQTSTGGANDATLAETLAFQAFAASKAPANPTNIFSKTLSPLYLPSLSLTLAEIMTYLFPDGLSGRRLVPVVKATNWASAQSSFVPTSFNVAPLTVSVVPQSLAITVPAAGADAALTTTVGPSTRTCVLTGGLTLEYTWAKKAGLDVDGLTLPKVLTVPATADAAHYSSTTAGTLSFPGGKLLQGETTTVSMTAKVTVHGLNNMVFTLPAVDVVFSSNLKAPPLLLNARFTPDLKKVMLYYDVETDAETRFSGVSPELLCSQYFAAKTFNALGASPRCVWTDAKTMEITLGASFLLRPHSHPTLPPIDYVLYPEAHSEIVVTSGVAVKVGISAVSLPIIASPQVPSSPVTASFTIALTAPESVAPCTTQPDYAFAATQVTGDVVMRLSYEWELKAVASTVNIDNAAAVNEGLVGIALHLASEHASILKPGHPFSDTASPSYVPTLSLSATAVRSFLVPGVSYTARVVATNWYGLQHTVEHTFTVPTSQFTVGTLPTHIISPTATTTLTLPVALGTAVCSETDFTHSYLLEWTLLNTTHAFTGITFPFTVPATATVAALKVDFPALALPSGASAQLQASLKVETSFRGDAPVYIVKYTDIGGGVMVPSLEFRATGPGAAVRTKSVFIATRPASVSANYANAITLSAARFGNALNSIILTLSAPAVHPTVSQTAPASAAACGQMLEASTIAKLGAVDTYACSLRTTSATPGPVSTFVTVRLGDNYTLRVGNTVSIKAGFIPASGHPYVPSTVSSVIIAQPTTLLAPQVTLSVPETTFICNNVLLDASATSRTGGLRPSYAWEIVPMTVAADGFDNSVYVTKFAALVSSLKVVSADYSTTGSPSYLPFFTINVANVPEYFPLDVTQTIRVTVRSWVGAETVVTAPIRRISTATPKAYFPSGNVQTLVKSKTFVAGVELSAPCMTDVDYELSNLWAQLSGPTTVAIHQLTRGYLHIPAHGTQVNGTYRFNYTGILRNKVTNVEASTSLVLEVRSAPTPLALVLTGGSRVHAIDVGDGSLTLSSLPTDADDQAAPNSGFTFVWSCTHRSTKAPCFGSALPTTASITIPRSELVDMVPMAANDALDFVVTATKTGRVVSAGTWITVKDDASYAPSIAPLTTGSRTSTSTPLRITASIASSNQFYQLQWSSESRNLRLQTPGLLSTSVTDNVLAIPANTLAPGTYSFRLSAFRSDTVFSPTSPPTVSEAVLDTLPPGPLPDEAASAVITVELVAPPSGGSCFSIPAQGYANETFVFTCRDWVIGASDSADAADDDGASAGSTVYYSWSVQKGAYDVDLGAPSLSPSLRDVILSPGNPADNYNRVFAVSISDGVGGVVTTTFSTRVLPVPSTTDVYELATASLNSADELIKSSVIPALGAGSVDAFTQAVVSALDHISQASSRTGFVDLPLASRQAIQKRQSELLTTLFVTLRSPEAIKVLTYAQLAYIVSAGQLATLDVDPTAAPDASSTAVALAAALASDASLLSVDAATDLLVYQTSQTAGLMHVSRDVSTFSANTGAAAATTLSQVLGVFSKARDEVNTAGGDASTATAAATLKAASRAAPLLEQLANIVAVNRLASALPGENVNPLRVGSVLIEGLRVRGSDLTSTVDTSGPGSGVANNAGHVSMTGDMTQHTSGINDTVPLTQTMIDLSVITIADNSLLQLAGLSADIASGVSFPNGTRRDAKGTYSPITSLTDRTVRSPYVVVTMHDGTAGAVPSTTVNLDGTDVTVPKPLEFNSVDGSAFIDVTIPHPQTAVKSGASPVCQYWKEATAGGEGRWSTKGCKTIRSNINSTVCRCTHMTLFSVDFSQFSFSPAVNTLDGEDFLSLTWGNLSSHPVPLIFIAVWFAAWVLCMCIARRIDMYKDVRGLRQLHTRWHASEEDIEIMDAEEDAAMKAGLPFDQSSSNMAGTRLDDLDGSPNKHRNGSMDDTHEGVSIPIPETSSFSRNMKHSSVSSSQTVRSGSTVASAGSGGKKKKATSGWYYIKEHMARKFRYNHLWLSIFIRENDDSFSSKARVTAAFIVILSAFSLQAIFYGQGRNAMTDPTRVVITLTVLIPFTFFLFWVFHRVQPGRLKRFVYEYAEELLFYQVHGYSRFYGDSFIIGLPHMISTMPPDEIAVVAEKAQWDTNQGHMVCAGYFWRLGITDVEVHLRLRKYIDLDYNHMMQCYHRRRTFAMPTMKQLLGYVFLLGWVVAASVLILVYGLQFDLREEGTTSRWLAMSSVTNILDILITSPISIVIRVCIWIAFLHYCRKRRGRDLGPQPFMDRRFTIAGLPGHLQRDGNPRGADEELGDAAGAGAGKEIEFANIISSPSNVSSASTGEGDIILSPSSNGSPRLSPSTSSTGGGDGVSSSANGMGMNNGNGNGHDLISAVRSMSSRRAGGRGLVDDEGESDYDNTPGSTVARSRLNKANGSSKSDAAGTNDMEPSRSLAWTEADEPGSLGRLSLTASSTGSIPRHVHTVTPSNIQASMVSSGLPNTSGAFAPIDPSSSSASSSNGRRHTSPRQPPKRLPVANPHGLDLDSNDLTDYDDEGGYSRQSRTRISSASEAEPQYSDWSARRIISPIDPPPGTAIGSASSRNRRLRATDDTSISNGISNGNGNSHSRGSTRRDSIGSDAGSSSHVVLPPLGSPLLGLGLAITGAAGLTGVGLVRGSGSGVGAGVRATDISLPVVPGTTGSPHARNSQPFIFDADIAAAAAAAIAADSPEPASGPASSPARE